MSQKLETRNGKHSFRYFDLDGHFRRHTCESPLKGDAEKEKNKFLAELEESRTKNINKKYNIDTLLWTDFITLYLRHSQLHKQTISDDKTVIKHINRLFTDIKYLKDFDRQKIETFRLLRLKEVKKSSINRNVHCIQSMWSFAVKDLELDIKNQAADIKDFPVALLQKIEFFTLEQIKKILTQANPIEIRTLCCLMLSFGLRLKEAANVKWEDINFSTNRILIRPYKTFNRNPQPVSLTMPNFLIAYLKKLKRTSAYVIGVNHTSRKDLGCLSVRVKKQFKRIVGFGTAHTCRHTYITHTVNNPNIAERDILKTARIKNRKILDVYGHYTQERERIIANEVYKEPPKLNMSISEIDIQIKKLLELKEQLISNS